MNDNRDEAGARGIACAHDTICWAHLSEHGTHSVGCNAMTAAILAYGDARAAGEREKINAVLRKAWSEEVAERLIREAGD
jgi:hypothetical protein